MSDVSRDVGTPHRPPDGPRLVHYAVAAASVVLALGAGWALRPLTGGGVPLTLFGLAVVAAAWVGGAGPGLLATLLSLGAAGYATFGAGEPPPLAGPGSAARAALFALLGAVISLLGARRPAGRASAEASASLREDQARAASATEALRRAAARHGAELAVLRVMTDAATREDAYPRLLRAVCEALDWDVGAAWLVDEQAAHLRCAAVWRRDEVKDAAFASATLRLSLGPGEGLPGRVWTAAEPAWVRDVQDDPSRPRHGEAVAAGLHTAFAFPVTLGNACIGVMEFLSRAVRAEEADLLDGLAPLGGQIAQFVVRKGGEEERDEILAREQNARREAEEANRTKDQFLSTLSHELRTPLNAIVGWAHLLKTGQLDEANTARAVDVIDRNARSQSQIISDVLDVSRIVTGRLRLDVRRMNARTPVEEAVNAVEAAAQAKDLRLSVQLEPGESPVSADPDRLRQIVWNLLSNAVKFTPGGGTVTVALRRLPSTVEIVVADTGVGIEPDFLPHVFERFRQRDSSSTRAHGGLGLGLALVRHLVELHGGSVTAESGGPGQGARFTVRLPISVPEAERQGDGVLPPLPDTPMATPVEEGTGTPAGPPGGDPERPVES